MLACRISGLIHRAIILGGGGVQSSQEHLSVVFEIKCCILSKAVDLDVERV